MPSDFSIVLLFPRILFELPPTTILASEVLYVFFGTSFGKTIRKLFFPHVEAFKPPPKIAI